jgi:hypothetical protein
MSNILNGCLPKASNQPKREELYWDNLQNTMVNIRTTCINAENVQFSRVEYWRVSAALYSFHLLRPFVLVMGWDYGSQELWPLMGPLSFPWMTDQPTQSTGGVRLTREYLRVPTRSFPSEILCGLPWGRTRAVWWEASLLLRFHILLNERSL